VFDALQQIVDFNVGVAIVRIFDFGRLPKTESASSKKSRI
jgi:hypothetical protein